MLARLFVYLQHLLPRFWLTAIVYRIARIKNLHVKNALIKNFIRLYDVDTEEVRLAIPDDFATFNDFFVRELDPAARVVDSNPDSIVSPVDGTVSLAGRIDANLLLQAKGISYSVEDLLATDLDAAHCFTDGHFATIYLAPYNYHRVHAPLAGNLVSGLYVPGDLFSVNQATAARIRGLFRRNERLILHLETDAGPAAVIFVGALNVGSISTPWSGEIRPRKRGMVEPIDLFGQNTRIEKGGLLGWFNMGSTVIVLLPKDGAAWRPSLTASTTLRMGDVIGRIGGTGDA